MTPELALVQNQDEDFLPGDSGMPPDAAPVDNLARLLGWTKAINIADDLDESTLGEIGAKVVREYEIDDNSRDKWKAETEKAIKLAMQEAEEKSYPFAKASNVIFPLMTSAALQFAARAYPAIINGREIVKGVVVGDDNGTPAVGQDGQPMPGPDGQPLMAAPAGVKRDRANRIAEHMSWQLLDEMPEWEPETDVLLHALPIVGCAFRKTYFDPSKGRNVSTMVPALNMVINYHAKGLEIAPRLTEELHLYPIEIEENERAKLWREIEYTGEADSAQDKDAPVLFLEQHRWLDLDEDDYPEPYIVTVHKQTSKVVRIVARYDHDGVKLRTDADGRPCVARIEPIHYYTKYDFLPSPDGGIYGKGFGQLLKPINDAVNSTLNMLIDSGHLANMQSGFVGKNLSMHSGASTMKFAPGEWKQVNNTGVDISKSLVPLPIVQPSNVLFQLLGMLVEAGREVAAIKDVLTGDQPQANTPATTTLALIEQGLKVFTSIYKRVHRALKSELAKIYRLNRIYLPQDFGYNVGDVWKSISQADYAQGAGVEPVSDPTMVSDMQRLGRAQFLLQFAQNPLMDPHAIIKRVLDAAGIDKVEELFAKQPPVNPMIAVKGMELEIRGREAEANINAKKATEVRDLSQGILNLAQADSVVGDQHLAWVEQNLAATKMMFEAATQGQQSQQDAGAGTGAGVPPAPQGAPPAPPSQMVGGAPVQPAPIPGGMTSDGGGAPSGMAPEAPMEGAKRAPDGHWYLPDPARQGKYLRLAMQ